jgi:hypothetical protein
MIGINRDGLSPMMLARLETELLKKYYNGGVIMSMEEMLNAEGSNVKRVFDGRAGYNRRKFNNMLGPEQRAYEARLKAKREYFVGIGGNLWRKIPKIVYDSLVLPVDEKSIKD